jgi:hypothetical protein
MVYIAPKVNVTSPRLTLIEFGFNPNYKVGNDYLVSATVGNQTSMASQLSIFVSLGLIRLF